MNVRGYLWAAARDGERNVSLEETPRSHLRDRGSRHNKRGNFMASGTYDIITVGGGLGGSSLAKVMAEHGARVLVLDLALTHVEGCYRKLRNNFSVAVERRRDGKKYVTRWGTWDRGGMAVQGREPLYFIREPWEQCQSN